MICYCPRPNQMPETDLITEIAPYVPEPRFLVKLEGNNVDFDETILELLLKMLVKCIHVFHKIRLKSYFWYLCARS